MLMFWWQLYLCLQLRSLSLPCSPHASNYTVGLCDSLSLIGVLIAFCPETMRFSMKKKSLWISTNSMAGILNNSGAAFPFKKKKRRERLIREWLITWILYLIVCNKMGDGSRKVLPLICLLLLEYLLDFFLLPPPCLELNMVVVTHCNNSFASQETGVLVLFLPQAFCILPL